MLNILQSEAVKYRRTFTKRLIWLSPLFFILIALPQKLFMPPDYMRPWPLLVNQVFNWWPVIFLPMGMALFAALVAVQERKAGSYRALRSRDVPPAAVWVGKVLIMAFHTLVASAVLVAATIVAGLITAGGDMPLPQIIAGGLLTWLSSLTILPLQLWIATWKGLILSMALGFLGMIAGVVAAAEAWWVCVPWAWPIRLMCPVIGVHPNGVMLEAGSALLDPSAVHLGIAVSLAAFVLILALTAAWFAKREVR